MSLEPPRVVLLRTSHLWACLSHFVHTFQRAINLSDVSIADVEEDLASGANTAVPKLVYRLLYILTYDRKINPENFASYLRKQFAKRLPHMLNPLGTEDDPVEWSSLDMMVQLQLIVHVCEWMFTGPARLRTMMGDENELSWRLEPIGQDSKRNTYWFIGPDRLWVQHPNPNPPEPRRTRGRRAAASKPKAKTAPRTRNNLAISKAKNAPTTTTKGRSRPTRSAATQAAINIRARSGTALSTNTRTTRSSKRAAPVDSDIEEDSSFPSKRLRTTRASTSRSTRATRNSARLRSGADDEDEWQAIPVEWLHPEHEENTQGSTSSSSPKANPPPRAKSSKKPSAEEIAAAVFGDDDSDLTELSESEKDEEVEGDDEGQAEQDLEEPEEDEQDDEDDDDEMEIDEETAIREAATRPLDYLEWETVCASLDDWEVFPLQFEGSSSMKEKALYKVLMLISTDVCEQLREAARKIQLTVAVHTRKRSSRLLVIEQERQALEAERAKKQEVEEAQSREMRQIKREQARLQRETERENRAKEREERLKAKELEAALALANESHTATPGGEDSEAHIDVVGSDVDPRSSSAPTTNGKTRASGRGRKTGARAHGPRKSDDWELDCEICQQKGVNIDDGREITCCERCGRWQHVDCHDHADETAGRPKRDWNAVEFYCQDCSRNPPKRARAARNPRVTKTVTPNAALAPTKSKSRGTTAAKPQPPPGPPPPSGYPSHWAAREGYNVPSQFSAHHYGRQPVAQTLPSHQQYQTQGTYSYPTNGAPYLPPASASHYPQAPHPSAIPSHLPSRSPYPINPQTNAPPAAPQSVPAAYGMPNQFFPASYTTPTQSSRTNTSPSYPPANGSYPSQGSPVQRQPPPPPPPTSQGPSPQQQYAPSPWTNAGLPQNARPVPLPSPYSQAPQYGPQSTNSNGYSHYYHQQSSSNMAAQPVSQPIGRKGPEPINAVHPSEGMSQRRPSGSWNPGVSGTANGTNGHAKGYGYPPPNGHMNHNTQPRPPSEQSQSNSPMPQTIVNGGYGGAIPTHVRPPSSASMHSTSQSPAPGSVGVRLGSSPQSHHMVPASSSSPVPMSPIPHMGSAGPIHMLPGQQYQIMATPTGAPVPNTHSSISRSYPKP